MKTLRAAEFNLILKKKRILFGAALVILLLAEAVISQTTPQSAIADAAAEYGLGRPRAESPQPVQTPAPRNEGWWQAFERGWVYWHPRYGARVVKEKIFEAWSGQRWEQGTLGFPSGSETNCTPPDDRDFYQSFEGGKIYWNAATNRASVFTNAERFGEGGKCFAPAHGRFRVTINGFTCNHPTIELVWSPDGMDDEVFVASKNFTVEKPAGDVSATVSAPWETRTYDIGDTSSGAFPQRIRGGSSRRLGANGGFRAGDSFPESPQKHSTNSQSWGLPLLLWEGILTRRQNAAVFIPTIWEWDGAPYPLYALWQHVAPDALIDVGLLIENSNSVNQDSVKNSIRNDIIQRVLTNSHVTWRPVDHPIGMREYDAGEYRLRPEVFILTYDEALRMTQSSQTKNGEAFPFTYRDADSLGGGDYTLYLQVEQLPD
ncbi:MAG: hypothetical protein M3033_01615 [Acidobacteriota bacterium]|nr:hypothetical protein [Acidobacteriota bacterium]